MEMYWAQEYEEKIDDELEVLTRKHPRKYSFTIVNKIIWDEIMKVVDKYRGHMELIHEKTKTIRRARGEIIGIINVLGDSSTNNGVIVNIVNHILKEEVVNSNNLDDLILLRLPE